MRAPVTSCSSTSSASYCTGRSKQTSTGLSSWRLTTKAERPSANVRAISRGRPSSGHEVGDPAGRRDAHAGRHRERAVQRAAPLEHRDPSGVVELVEQQVAHAVVLLELDAVVVELLSQAAGRSGEQLVDDHATTLGAGPERRACTGSP